MTKLIKSISEWKQTRATLKDKIVGFVATMGNLHKGHLSLIQRSIDENEVTVVSCFVNPTQFEELSDLKNYPRSVEEDIALCKKVGVDYLFLPDYTMMYPDQYRYQIIENDLSNFMEGKHRPGHLTGMLTVVLKLLNLMRPNNAYFGEKDFQQLRLVKGLAEAFFLDTNIVSCETVRDERGLPLSSRNQYLTEEQRELSRCFPEYLRWDQSCEVIASTLMDKGFEVEYIEEYDRRRFGAVRLGEVRLIDNVDIDSILNIEA